MKKILIFGTTDLAELVYFYIQKDKLHTPAAFTTHKQYLKQNTLFNLPVVPFEDIAKNYSPKEFSIALCIGYTKVNEARKKIFYEIKERGYQIENIIFSSSRVETDNMGEGNIILPYAAIDPFCKIGNGNIFYPNSLLSHHSAMGDFNFIAVNACIAGNVTIHDNNFIGANATIKNGATIGSYNLIGANAYVSHQLTHNQVIVPQQSIVLTNKQSSDFL
jgi:sugar O-acyltransferase (sialic acid O-acetyltransferase NeuD family)